MKTAVGEKSWVFLVLLLLGFLAYHNVFSYPFVHDDRVFISQNPDINRLNLVEIFRQQAFHEGHIPIINTYYRPLLDVLYRLLYKVFGQNPAGYHIFNIFLHVLNALLVYLCLGRIPSVGKNVSLAAAVLFLLHPVQTEAVACIAGISNLVMGIAFLGSFYFFMRWQANPKDAEALFDGLGIFFIGLFAKEQIIALPLLVLFYMLLFGDRRRSLAAFGWYMLPVLAYLGLRLFVFHMKLPAMGTHLFELWLRMRTIPATLVTDMQLILLPLGLHYYRSVDILAPVLLPTVIFVCLGVLLVWLGSRLPTAEKKVFFFGLGWFVLVLLPVLNILPLIQEYSLILTFEHFLYLPLIGFALSVCVWVHAKAGDAPALPWVLIVLGGFLFLATLQQNTYWRGEIPLFQRALQYEQSGRLHQSLARAYYLSGRYPEAVEEIQKGIAVFKGYLPKIQSAEAKPFYRYNLSEMYFDLGNDYMALRQWPQAAAAFEEAVAFNAKNVPAYNNLAFSDAHLGKIEEARQIMERIKGGL